LGPIKQREIRFINTIRCCILIDGLESVDLTWGLRTLRAVLNDVVCNSFEFTTWAFRCFEFSTRLCM